jgi:hypothetical protein
MPRAHIDHLVITSPSLAVGVAHVRRALGVAPQPGGQHPKMGTHNCFVRLGERVYLEVIAVDPAAPRPGRPRWFALDEPAPAPRLAAWVARSDDIRAAVLASPADLGKIEAASRGNLSWLITIPEDGGLVLGGVAPQLIQWPEGVHPTSTLPDSGCSLIRLEAFHPEPDKVRAVLRAIGFEGELGVSPLPAGGRPYLVAHIETPAGLRRLGAP